MLSNRPTRVERSGPGRHGRGWTGGGRVSVPASVVLSSTCRGCSWVAQARSGVHIACPGGAVCMLSRGSDKGGEGKPPAARPTRVFVARRPCCRLLRLTGSSKTAEGMIIGLLLKLTVKNSTVCAPPFSCLLRCMKGKERGCRQGFMPRQFASRAIHRACCCTYDRRAQQAAWPVTRARSLVALLSSHVCSTHCTVL